MRARVYLLLGTNLGDRQKNLQKVKEYIQALGKIEEESKVMETKPVGFSADQDFLNQVIIIETKRSPISLLKDVKKVEQKMGRVYTKPKEGEKYSSRIIDIDILMYNDVLFDSENLVIPHPQVRNRYFVEELLQDLIKK